MNLKDKAKNWKTNIPAIFFCYHTPKLYQDALTYIESEGIKSYGVLVYGKCADILDLRTNTQVHSLFINDIKLSYYSK